MKIRKKDINFMKCTPLENESIYIAVFSLALFGSNYEDYFKDAYYILTYDGVYCRTFIFILRRRTI